jgi:hypothetical protein
MPVSWIVPTLSEQAARSRYDLKMETVAVSPPSLSKPFGQFDEHAPIGGILDFSECNDEPQTFGDGQIDLIVQKQLLQDITGRIGIVRVHNEGSRSE